MTSRDRAQQVDTQLADLYEHRWESIDRLTATLRSIHYTVRDRQLSKTRWAMTDAQAVEALTAQVEQESTGFHPNRNVHARLLADVTAWHEAIARADEAIRPLADEYGRDPWPRFFLVTNAGGHIHKDMRCSTCHPTTRYGWLPSLSGLTEADAVTEQGPRLCSVCYPSAPVEWTLGLPSTPKCPGSSLPGTRIGRTRYGTCSVCAKSFALSSTGLIRAHKPQEA